MIRGALKEVLGKALVKAGQSQIQPQVFLITDPKFGDYYTNVAFEVAKNLNKQNTYEIAKELVAKIDQKTGFFSIEVAKNGLINFRILPSFVQSCLKKIIEQNETFGSSKLGSGRKARVEFVSANPVGPLHFGNARGGPIGDTIASVLEFSGWQVVREYLHNDIGGQVNKLGETLLNVSKGQRIDQQEYKGEYVKELSEKIGQISSSKEAGRRAVNIMLEEILRDCRDMGIKFDQVYAESNFAETGKTKEALDELGERNVLKVKEGAVWFAPKNEFLKDRECVLVKSDGEYTYFANDIAYHKEKFRSNPNLVIDIFGANHHGHVPRLKAAISALGFDPRIFQVILYQWVRFKRGSELVKMSKRAGTFITAREVIDEVGKDALRFFILMHAADSPIDFDLELAKEKSNENPVYYVQYAHARIASILKTAETKGFSLEDIISYHPKLINKPLEIELLKHLVRFPELVEDISQNFAVHLLTSYCITLADLFHKFYEQERVLADDKDLTKARLALILGVKIVLRNSLKLMGVSAPESM